MAQSYGLTAIDRPQWAFYANLAGLGAQVAVTVWLVHALHVQGAAVALLVGSVVVMIVRQLFYSREMRSA
jgi:O-antigen/teichoic acid export membrane protein